MQTPQPNPGDSAAHTGKPMPQQAPAGSRAPLRILPALALLVLGVLLGGASAHFALERPALEAAQARAQLYEQELAALRARVEQADNAAAALEGRLMVEESTRRGLESGLQTMQEELGRARDTLAFYEQLMPPGPKGAVRVRALDVQRSGPHLRYRVLLMRSGANQTAFQGVMQFQAHGRLDGKEVTVPLVSTMAEPVESGQEAAADDDALAVEFTDFQRGSGLLSLPPGFEPESVTLNVLEGRNVRTSHSVTLDPVLSP